MLKTSSLAIVSGATGDGLLTRREAARRLLAGIAAGVAWPLRATGHPIWKHLEDEHLMHHADAELTASNGKLHFLDANQMETLSSLAEAIVPGSAKARVAAFIDLLLSVDTKKHQGEFVSSLVAIDSESSKRHGKVFAALPAQDQNSLLESISAKSQSVASDAPLRAAFKDLKEWISGAYYSSETGMRELGWTPDRVFAEFPGCSHPEGHS